MANDGVGILGNKTGRLGRFVLGRAKSRAPSPGGAIPCPYIPTRSADLPNVPTFPIQVSETPTLPQRPLGTVDSTSNRLDPGELPAAPQRPIPVDDTFPVRKPECR